ncbi:MAG: hypothetical protein OHK0046_45940 [Anaerolineae bacterium]
MCAQNSDVLQIAAGTYLENISIDKDVTLQGEGATQTIIDGQNGGRVITVLRGSELQLSGVTITNGSAQTGGLIYTEDSTLTITDVVLQNGAASGNGGAIATQGGTINLVRVFLHSNTASIGGGIFTESGTVSIDSTTFANNTALTQGGGLVTRAGSVTAVNSTFSANSATAGGGLYTSAGHVSLNHVTLALNSGGEIANEIGIVNVSNTLIAGTCVGKLTSEGHNLIQTLGNCILSGTTAGDLVNVDSLVNIELDTSLPPVHALFAGSPAIDAGNSSTCANTDQRGTSRPQGAGCDIGAYEATGNEPIATPTQTPDSSATPEPTSTSTAEVPGGSATPTSPLPDGTVTPTVTTTPLPGMSRLAPAPDALITNAAQYVSKFQWVMQEDAEWYHVFVSTPDFSQVFFDKWYMASEVCSGSICTTSDDIWLLGNGQIAWWMTYWNPTIGDDYINLYAETTFTLNLPQPGVVAEATYSDSHVLWDHEPQTLWYQVWFGPSDYLSTQYLSWINAGQFCDNGICDVIVGGMVADTDYELWLQTWSPAGLTEWHKVADFPHLP